MTAHHLRLDPAPADGRWNASGAVTIEDSKAPVVEAVAKLILSGTAKPSDTCHIAGYGAPFTVRINRLLDYRPSSARRGVEQTRLVNLPSHFQT
jgi:hypothetical protein